MSEKSFDDSLSPDESGSASNSPSVATKQNMLGKFRLLSVLGKGSMGKVLRAQDTQLKRHVALKCLRKDKGAATYRTEQFIREARSAAALEHPSIVQIYEVGTADSYHYIAMELIEGGSLGSMVKACGPLDLLRACQLTAEAAEALAYAAQMGIVHRDIKPENLMLTRNGRCKITDFGLAHIDDPTDGFAMPSGAIGTPNYMAPELIRALPASAKSDVYALACVLFFLLTGRPPFFSKDRAQILRMHTEVPPPDISTLRPDLPDSLAKVLARALSKNPDERPTPDTFAKQLRAHTIPVSASGSQILPNASSPFIPALPPTPAAAPAAKKGNLVLYGSLATVAALLIVAITIFVMNANKPQPTQAQPSQPQVAQPLPVPPQPVTPIIQTPPVTPAPLPTPVVVAPTPASAPTPVVVAPVPAPTPEPAPPKTSAKKPTPDIKVSDAAALLAAAKANRKITILATPTSVQVDKCKKLATLTFTDNPDFKVIYYARIYSSMTKKFGGTDGNGLLNKPQLITGYPILEADKPQLIITSASQIEPAN